MQISYTPEFAARLEHELNAAQELYQLERALGQDLLLTGVGWASSYYREQGDYVDEWGVGWRSVEYDTPYGPGYYTDFAHHPLAQDDALDGYRPPDPDRSELYDEAEWLVQNLSHEYWIVGVTVCAVFETAWALRGYEQMLVDLALNPDLAHRILDIPYHYHLAAAKRLVQIGVDMIWLGDDVGAQQAMLISPRMWRKFLKPRMASLIGELKALNPQLRVAYHSDGSIYPIIPDLIEIGLDVLNPVQPASMDPAWLKQEYGDRLCFWGTIDEQHTLPFGSADDVRAKVHARLQTVGRNGGLILGPTHNVQLDTPMENFRAMVDTITHTPYPVA
jgi:uroporphyrinogen decarboxylase